MQWDPNEIMVFVPSNDAIANISNIKLSLIKGDMQYLLKTFLSHAVSVLFPIELISEPITEMPSLILSLTVNKSIEWPGNCHDLILHAKTYNNLLSKVSLLALMATKEARQCQPNRGNLTIF